MNVPSPVAHSACNGLHPVSDSRELGVSALRSGAAVLSTSVAMSVVGGCCRKIRFFAYRYGLSIEMHRQLLLKQS